MDAIPGRVNRLILEPTELGVFNGACAEFCGTAHAQMGLRVVVVSEQRFAEYVRRQAEPARRTNALGFKLFRQSGCGACHTVRGTQADADVGPDLTHLASRRTLAAGLLPMTKDNIAAFIGSPDHLKPGVEMPSFDVLPTGQIDEIAKWLGSLE
jgi:cytochrome c oxidase subunit II